MKKRNLLLLLMLALMLLAVTACGGGAEAPVEPPVEAPEAAAVNPLVEEAENVLYSQLDPMPTLNQGERIGVLVIALSNSFWAEMKECYEAAGQDLGIEVEVAAAASESDTTGQMEALDAMIVKDFDAIIVSPIEGTNLIPAIVRANQSQVPIINLGPGVNVDVLTEAGGYLDGKITVNFEIQGGMVADAMIEEIGAEGGEIAIIQGLAGAAQSEGRSAGAKARFEETGGYTVVSVQPGDWDRNKAYDITVDLLQANPELKGIFACNDVMALGAVEAIKAAGKEGVVVYGVDGTTEALDSIRAGELSGSITYSKVVYTKAGELLALKIAQGQEVSAPVYAPLSIVNAANINDFEGFK
ncbi:MAG: substrate-binding domain-containing protein [Syntrophomonadaceae bacterium]|nr:substrate-binding domain-containing protein [Syntrophomonadaceae bacterium]